MPTHIVELADSEFETVKKLFRKHDRWHGLTPAERLVQRKIVEDSWKKAERFPIEFVP